MISNKIKIAAIVLIVASVLGLEYGSFSHIKEIHQATMGFIDLSSNDMHMANASAWAGMGAIVIGGAYVFFGNRGK
jgi:hypothetical protein